MKNKALYYFLSLTWGLPMTLIGAAIALALIVSGHKPKRWGGCIYFSVGKSWGGLNLGMFFLTDKRCTERTRNHEFGHSIQNCRYGFLMPFIVCIPSATRYWYREWMQMRGIPNKTAYDDIWFEGEATKLGNQYIRMWQHEIKEEKING